MTWIQKLVTGYDTKNTRSNSKIDVRFYVSTSMYIMKIEKATYRIKEIFSNHTLDEGPESIIYKGL